MELNIHDHKHAVVLEVSGRFLGTLDGEAFKAAINTLKKAGTTRVVVDLGQTELMDSTAIGTVIASLTTLRRVGGDIRLASLPPRIRTLFKMTRLLGHVFESFDTREAAVASFKKNPRTMLLSLV